MCFFKWTIFVHISTNNLYIFMVFFELLQSFIMRNKLIEKTEISLRLFDYCSSVF